MRIYVFKSETMAKLQAFAGDGSGSQLPVQFAPWTATGMVPAQDDLPFRLSRKHVEKAIGDQGFQLWRPKPKKDGGEN